MRNYARYIYHGRIERKKNYTCRSVN